MPRCPASPLRRLPPSHFVLRWTSRRPAHRSASRRWSPPPHAGEETVNRLLPVRDLAGFPSEDRFQALHGNGLVTRAACAAAETADAHGADHLSADDDRHAARLAREQTDLVVAERLIGILLLGARHVDRRLARQKRGLRLVFGDLDAGIGLTVLAVLMHDEAIGIEDDDGRRVRVRL